MVQLKQISHFFSPPPSQFESSHDSICRIRWWEFDWQEKQHEEETSQIQTAEAQGKDSVGSLLRFERDG